MARVWLLWMGIVAGWCTPALAHAATDGVDGEVEDLDPYEPPSSTVRNETRPRRVHAPPIRVELRTPFRVGIGPGAALGMGVQIARTRRITFDAAVAYTSGRQLLTPGPFRSMYGFEGTSHVELQVGRFLAVGPMGGVVYEWFVQQGNGIDAFWTPVLGVRVDTWLLRARKWGLGISARATSDLASTQFVLETQQVVTRSPIEGQLGLRFDFGHGRVNGERVP